MRVEATLDERFACPGDPAAVRAAMVDADRLIACHGHLKWARRLDDDVIEFTLEPLDTGIIGMSGFYRARWHIDGEHVCWTTVHDEGWWAEGSAHVTAAHVHWRGRWRWEVDAPRVVGWLARSPLERMVASEQRAFAQRLIAAIARTL